MFLGVLNIFAAIVLSIVSAYFSLNGIQTIFSGAVIGATLMGGSLEFAKISATVWLYSWWKKSSKWLKGYLIFAVSVLILISSIGIFGFLSKAYVQQGTSVEQLQSQVSFIDTNIQRYETNIGRYEEQLRLLDESIDIYFEYDQATRGLDQLDAQEERRQAIQNNILQNQNSINELLNQRFEIEQRISQESVDVGPIRYIAAILYGEDNAEDRFDDAARLFIILLVLVFDPFAVLLMVSGNMAIDEASGKKKRKRRTYKPRKKKEPKKVEKKEEPKETIESLFSDKVNEEEQKKEKESEQIEPEPEPETETKEEEDGKIVVDMSNYVNPETIRDIKKRSDHPLRRKKNS